MSEQDIKELLSTDLPSPLTTIFCGCCGLMHDGTPHRCPRGGHLHRELKEVFEALDLIKEKLGIQEGESKK